tara:strand:- start:483 stop:944 length:462 start_codon:yes stop_codon:yes gene_type:complete
MAVTLVKTVNFGTSKGSLTTVGYRVLNSLGVISGSRTTSGVGEIIAAAGIYSASIYFESNFNGSVLWDTGGAAPAYASEEYNSQVDNINTQVLLVSASVDFTRHMTSGKWKIDVDADQMIFYKEDNSTEIARYDLRNQNGDKDLRNVFIRNKV